MENKLITLAIHTEGKALILKRILESNNIEVYIEKVDKGVSADGYYIRINENNVPRALSIIEANNLFNYNDQRINSIDDGRKRILVAVDFSIHSRNACIVAFNIAQKINAKVKILHVYHNLYFPSTFPFADQLKDKEDVGLLDKVRKQMLDFCYEIDNNMRNGDLPSINYSYSLREGIVEEEIEEFIEEYKPVLLVVGTRGKDDNGKKIVGDVTADIVEMTNIPILAVPGHLHIDKETKARHIAFLTNLNKRDLASFNTLVQILQPVEAVRVTLIHINRKREMKDSELVKMREYINNSYPNFNVKYELIETGEELINFIDREQVNVVALNTRRRNMLGRMFAPSFSRKVLEQSESVAVLILRGLES